MKLPIRSPHCLHCADAHLTSRHKLMNPLNFHWHSPILRRIFIAPAMCRALSGNRRIHIQQARRNPMNPLDSVKGSIVTGVIIAIVIAVALSGGFVFNEFSLARWLHYLAGVMWIGL